MSQRLASLGVAQRLGAGIFLLALVAGCGPARPTLRSTMSKSGISILEGADRVEVFRVAPERDENSTGERIGSYPILSTGQEQDQTFAASLAAILLGDGVMQNSKKCGLEPGVAYRIWKGKREIEVLVCFECDVLWPHVVGEAGKSDFEEYQDFDSVRAQLLALAKKAFPDDAAIQGLSDRRH